ncbi:DUF1750-domain-containing protein [Dothidotthia symphoricarpi CBS 119687]|uniref:DUF1750-domain-containing protein n=1 Tax=Dothidotthia symphoricarpi CBS 119687 TaxID=1392245 RepID=A0A6A6AUD7_9PLEO|nr:DUF1750-domain-containing protein [Dothidotthia symphoricarpi CBS 119687]KAF2134808.1 DUF1750-domain-containing protein [Dothidotthia symphoricarpi CBS 119687]
MYGMQQAYNAVDPSAQVPPHLLAHVHLISSYRFPTLPSLQPAQALEYLIKGPQIVRDTSPVAWTYFASPPQDGTVVLAWQPPRMHTHFASDGIVWADAETAYDMNARGYTLQVLVHNSGYVYPHEPYAMHARFRYRIAAGPGAFDPNLWLIHYRPADANHRIPASQIPIPREMHATLQMRAQLQAAGPLMRKEFMLHDQANWPKVEFGQPAAMRGQQPYYNPMQPGRPYVAQPPPAKRQRGLPPQPQARPPVSSVIAPDPTLDDEENATHDAFDYLSPREISLSRYKQHHEWMEEIFSSPYAVGKIAPIDLGLGLMGELAPLTAGILDVPGAENADTAKENYQVKNYYKLDPAQLKDFETRVSEYTSKEQAEIEKMKADHARKMGQLKRTRTYIKAERRLRDLSRSVDGENEGSDPSEGVVQDLEESLGVTFDAKKSVVCVEKGGYIVAQQPQPQKAQVNGHGAQQGANGASNDMHNDGAMEADNTAASLLDQYGSGSLSGTPGNFSIPQMSQPPSQSQSAVGTPHAHIGHTSQPSTFDRQVSNMDADAGNDLLDLDVEMSGMTNSLEKDWVHLDEQSSGDAQHARANAQQAMTSNNLPATDSNALPQSNIDVEAGSMFDTADFGSFDNLDTAGDALADFGHDDNLGLDLVDDSAFGDAFHGTEMHHDDTGNGDNA